MQGIAEATEWKKKTFTADSTTSNGQATINKIKAYLPSSYRYAFALLTDPSVRENNIFLAAIFLPTLLTSVTGLRYRNGAMNINNNIDNSQVDLVLRSGDKVDIYWRSEPISNDVPATTWDYETIEPGVITRANKMQEALTNVGNYSAMISIADLDFNIIPSLNKTYCYSISFNSGSFSGAYIRVNNSTYQSKSTWTSTV